MQVIQLAATKFACKAREKVKGIDDEKYEVIYYGTYVFLADLSKTLIILIAAYFLGILKPIAFSMVAFGVLRSIVGGIHANTWFGCLLGNSFVFFLNVLLANILCLIKTYYLSIPVFIICAIIIYLYAPSDHKNKPIISKKQKQKLKIKAYIILSLQFILTFLLPPVYSCILILSALSACIVILPITYKLTKNEYGDAYWS